MTTSALSWGGPTTPPVTLGGLLLLDGQAIVWGTLLVLGGVFGLVGLTLALVLQPRAVGIALTAVGGVLLAIALPGAAWRAARAADVLQLQRSGAPASGEIVRVEENRHVRVNHRFTWQIAYRYTVNGEAYDGRVATRLEPDAQFSPGSLVSVRFDAQHPSTSTLAPPVQ